MEEFYPLVMDMIQIQPEPQRIAYEEAKEKGQTFIGVAANIGNRDMFAELVKAQVKVSQTGGSELTLDYGFPRVCPAW